VRSNLIAFGRLYNEDFVAFSQFQARDYFLRKNDAEGIADLRKL
jgi:hypothetical protein